MRNCNVTPLNSLLKVICSIMLALFPLTTVSQSYAAVILDGTMGRSGAVTGPNYAITSNLGTQYGANLFHSFSQFNLVKGDVATFSGPSNVSNIISRVTGGSASSIDGTIKSTISGANMYFLNPAGVMFGPNSSLDISGSFHVSTADYLKLGTDGRFDAKIPANSVLTVSPPSEFGFVSAKPAGISFDGTLLKTAEGKNLIVIGGDVSLNNTNLYAPSGTLAILSAASAGQAGLDGNSISSSNFTDYGTLTINDSRAYTQRPTYSFNTNVMGNIDASGSQGAGNIFIRSGDINLSGSRIVNDVYGSKNGADIRITAGNNISLIDSAQISVSTFSSGRGGNLSINASNSINLTNRAVILAQAEPESTGDAGTATIETGKLNIDDSAISGFTISSGKGGSLIVKASDSINLTNSGGIYIDSFIGDAGTATIETSKLNIDGDSQISGTTWLSGKGGRLIVKASDSINLTNGGQININTYDAGDAGTVIIETAKLKIDGSVSEISGSTWASGKGGSLIINASDSITLTNGGGIFVQTELGSSGDAGMATINTAKLNINDDGSKISSSTYSSGKGGSLLIKASDSINLTKGGAILVQTELESTGDAGTVTIETGKLNIVSDIWAYFDGLYHSRISASTFSSGKGGSLVINASDSINLTEAGSILVLSRYGTGDAGTATINTGKLNIDSWVTELTGSALSSGKGGSLVINASDSINLTNGGRIVVETKSIGNAGTATIQTTKLNINGNDSEISGSTLWTGKGGSLAINASDSINLTNGGAIAVETNPGSTGDAGTVTIGTGTLNIDRSVISGTTASSGKGGSLIIHASDSINLTNGGAISVRAAKGSSGDAGNATIETAKLKIDGSFSHISGETFSTGKGGSLTINASDSIYLTNAGSIVVDTTLGGGDAGTATIETAKLNIDTTSSISGSTSFGAGKGGDLIINVSDSINITNGGNIFLDTFQYGIAGTATIETAKLNIDGAGSQISASTRSSGKGGSLIINASDSINLTNAGRIVVQAETGSTGDAGTATIETSKLNIGILSGISGFTFSSGKGGSLTINASDSINLVNGGGITVDTIGRGDAGIVAIETGKLNIDNSSISGSTSRLTGSKSNSGKGGSLEIKASDSINLTNGGRIEVQANPGSTGDAGTTTIETLKLNIDGKDSKISGSTGSSGKGGNLAINASDSINLTKGGRIVAQTDLGSSGDAGNIELTAMGNLSISNGGAISSSTLASGNAGSVKVKAGSIAIDKQGSNYSTGIFSQANSGSTGNAGSIDVTATGNISIINGGVISSSTFSSVGAAGNVKANAGSIAIDGQDSRVETGIYSRAKAGTGNAGNVDVNVTGDLSIVRGGAISTSTSTSGNAGSIKVNAGDIAINGEDTIVTTGIWSDADYGSTGNAGNVDITAPGTFSLRNGIVSTNTIGGGSAGSIKVNVGTVLMAGLVGSSSISATASLYSSGQTGNVSVVANDITLSGSEISIANDAVEVSHPELLTPTLLSVTAKSLIMKNYGYITAETRGNVAAGNVEVTVAGATNIYNSGKITSDTYSSGSAGKITLGTGTLTISNDSAVSTNAQANSSGSAGNVNILSSSIMLTDKASISSSSSGTGKAGDISIKAVDFIKLTDSSITTSTVNADGGSITIDPILVDLKNSQITTSVKGGTGNGGNIDLTAKQLVVDKSNIIANAEGGNGGNINLNTQSVIQSIGSVISASSALGISGAISFSSPVVDIGAGLADMPNKLIDYTANAPKKCASSSEDISSFTVLEHGGSIATPDRPVVTQ